MTCEVCDREGCLRWAAQQRADAVFADMDRGPNDWADACAVMHEAEPECHERAVNWRAEAIAGRAREAALQAEVERLTRDLADADQDPATRGAL